MTIEQIFIRAAKGSPQVERERVMLVTGEGIEGDRYFGQHEEPGQNVTLVEAEAIEAFSLAQGRPYDLSITGRNFITRGVRLNELVGREFTVGGVTLRGVQICEPCIGFGKRLADGALTPEAVVEQFARSAGLRADVVRGGVVRRTDAVAIVD